MMLKPLLIAATLFTGTGAVHANPLTGKWDCSGHSNASSAMRLLLIYRSGGGFKHYANMAIGKPSNRFDASIVLNGRYKLEGNTIVEDASNARVTALTANYQDVSKTPVGRRMKSDLPRMFTRQTSRTGVTFQGPGKMRLRSSRISLDCTKR